MARLFKFTVLTLAICTTLLCTLLTWGSDAEMRGTAPDHSARNSWGFHGQVQTVLNRHTVLANDPRPHPGIFVPPALAWMKFDVSGNLVEVSSQQDQDGNAVGVTRTEFDAQGRELRAITAVDGKDIVSYNQYQDLPDGGNQHSMFSDGKLQVRTVSWHDAQGRLIKSYTYDSTNRLINDAAWKYDDEGNVNDWSVYGANHELNIHMVDRYDGEDALFRSGLDPSGRVVWTLSMRDGALTSWWSDTTCHVSKDLLPAWCRGSMGWSEPEKGTSHLYRIGDDGLIESIVEQHPGHGGNEPDTAELFDNTNRLLEKVVYQYERDGQGNWTSRTVSVLDESIGALVPIARDDRTITYY